MTNSNSFFKKTLALLLSIVFAISSFAVTGISALADDGEYFLMSYFTGNLQIEQQIKFAVSTNGKDFKPLYGGNAVLQEKSTDTNNYNGYTYTDGLRDPFIFDGHDGYYYCIATDLEATAYGFWGNQSQMVLWRSKDLINWSDAYYINVAQICNATRGTEFTNANFQRTWAPEVFYENGQYMIYFAFAGGDYQGTRMHYMITDDLMDWTHYSAPQVLYDPGYDDIDADIIKENDTYYMFYKDETPGRSTVCLATASAITGPYTYICQFDTSSATGGIEGCEVYTVGNNYYLVADRFGAAGNFAIYNMGSSLSAVAGAVNDGHISVTSSPISTVEELYGFTNLTPRHGSIMHISQSQYNALVADSGGVTDDDIMYNFTKSYSNTTTGWAYETYNDSSLHDVILMFKENGSSAKVAHDAGYITLKNATMFVNDETVRAMLPDDVYTVSFDYSLESTTNLPAPIFALGTGSGAPSANTDYVMMFGNGDMWVRKSGENTDTFVANKPLKLGVTYHYDVVSDGTNIKFFRDDELIGSIAATVDFPITGTRYAAFGFTDGHSSAGYGYGSYSRIRFRDRAVSSTEIKDESNALLYRKDDGTETINNKDNALDVSHSGNHNVAEPITSHIASSYSIAGWVNPGASVDYNSVIMGIGSGKWTPGPSGRYLAIREDGTILFNYCSGTNSGGNWSQHYVDINSAFSLSTNTWAYLQVNIVPISDNQVKFVVFKDGVQTLAQDITLTTKVDDNDTNGNDYAYGMLGMLQLTTNNIYLGRMEVPDWWQNENGTTYVKDVRFYAQAMDPDDLYREVLINRDAATARDYVRANLENYDVNANANKANRNAYHYESIATGGFNNVLASSYNDTVCADNEYDANWGRYKWFWPRNIVLMYDGVNTPALPVTFETRINSDLGHPKNKYLNTVYVNQSSSPNFKNAHYWTGYLNGDWTSWPGTTMPYAYKDYPADDGWNNGNPGGKNEVKDGYTHIGYDAGWQYDWQYTYDNTSTHRFFWNKVNYTGTVDEDDYYETYTKINYSSYDGGDRHFTDIDHNIYVVNYKPVYDILKSGSTVNVPNESDNLLTVYNSVKDNESDYTTDSLNQFYYAAYKLLTSNPVEYSEAAYQADFSGTVTLAANEIKAAMNEFNTINLVERASFTDFNTAANEAKDILDNNADDYTAASIENLQTVVDSSTYFTYDEDEKANTSADYQSAINAEKDAITAAINALVLAPANFTDLDAAINAGNNKINEIKSGSTLYTESTVNALIDAIEAAKTARATAYTVSDQNTVDTFTASVYTAIDGLSTEPAYAEGVDETTIASYEAAINKVVNIDTDIYDLGGVSVEDFVAQCLTAAAAANAQDGDIQTIADELTQEQITAIIADCLSELNNNVKKYNIYLEEGTFSEGDAVSADATFSGTSIETIIPGYQYKCDANTRLIIKSSTEQTAWYMSYEVDGVERRSKQYQEQGETFEVSLIGDLHIFAEQKDENKNNRVRIYRRYDDNSESLYSTQLITYVDDSYTLPSAPALAFYTFTGYTCGEDTYSPGDTINNINHNIDIYANYEHVDNNNYTVTITDVNGDELYNDSASYNVKIDVEDNNAYAWIDEDNDVFYVGSSLSFFVAESVTLQAITEEQFENGGYKTPMVYLRKEGAIVDENRITFNAQVVKKSTDVVVEYGILFGKSKGRTITEADLVLNNTGSNDNYQIIRAKSTKMFGANQFSIRINSSASGTFLYRGYAVYQTDDGLETVYTDVKTATID